MRDVAAARVTPHAKGRWVWVKGVGSGGCGLRGRGSVGDVAAAHRCGLRMWVKGEGSTTT